MSAGLFRKPRRDDFRVVVTGIGLVTTLGLGREATWQGLIAGKSGARWLDDQGQAGFPVAWDQPIGELDDPAHRYLLRAGDEAVADSGLLNSGVDRERVASLIGLSKGGFRSLVRGAEGLRSEGFDESILARLWQQSWPSSGACLLGSRFGMTGPALAPVAACATGLIAALQGADLIRRGVCDVALVGGADASLEPLLISAFQRMKALAKVPLGSDPVQAVRPWDRQRSGFLIGEGASVLVLERRSHALARRSQVYAELAGGAIGSDAYHETALNPDPTRLAQLIQQALEDADWSLNGVDSVNVHGTATLANDPLECRAIRQVFRSHADSLICSASKAQVGHLLGAAGSAELALAALSIRDGVVPPTLNLTDPDPACDLQASDRLGRAMPIRGVLKLSLGFGGHLAAAVLAKPD